MMRLTLTHAFRGSPHCCGQGVLPSEDGSTARHLNWTMKRQQGTLVSNAIHG
jgi:hypothetical protein